MLVGKHFQLENSNFLRELCLFQSHIISEIDFRRSRKRSEFFLLRNSFFVSKLCDVAGSSEQVSL